MPGDVAAVVAARLAGSRGATPAGLAARDVEAALTALAAQRAYLPEARRAAVRDDTVEGGRNAQAATGIRSGRDRHHDVRITSRSLFSPN